MENVLSGWKIAIGVLVTALVISMATYISDKSSELFKGSTEDVADSAQIISSYFITQYDDKTVTYDDLMTAIQDYSVDYEIRYQTLSHKDNGIDYRIYPGTEKDGHVAISRSMIEDYNSIDCINKDAKWHAKVNEDDQYIIFRQER